MAQTAASGNRTLLLLLLLTAACSLHAAGCRKQSLATVPSQSDQAISPAPQPNRRAAARAADRGELRLHSSASKNLRGTTHNIRMQEQTVKSLAAELNEHIALPFDIEISFRSCRDPDATYSEYARRITLCHELVQDYYRLFTNKSQTAAQLDQAVAGATAASFLHEVAHALIHAWQLPITGKEEDAADQFSILVLISCYPDGEQLALAAARSFKLTAQAERGKYDSYWDEHSLDWQRYFSSLCLLYGHNPKKYDYLVNRGGKGCLPQPRADTCADEHDQTKRAWQKLLAPYLKAPAPPGKQAWPYQKAWLEGGGK